MSTHDDGGPAFPGFGRSVAFNLGEKIVEEREGQSDGMTLLDYFAGIAFAQSVLDETERPSTFIAGKYMPTAEGIAGRAYVYADAMIKARKRR
jgi:hypothetical protein